MVSLEYLEKIREKHCLTWGEMSEIMAAIGYVAADNHREQAENFLVDLEEICYNLHNQ